MKPSHPCVLFEVLRFQQIWFQFGSFRGDFKWTFRLNGGCEGAGVQGVSLHCENTQWTKGWGWKMARSSPKNWFCHVINGKISVIELKRRDLRFTLSWSSVRGEEDNLMNSGFWRKTRWTQNLGRKLMRIALRTAKSRSALFENLLKLISNTNCWN